MYQANYFYALSRKSSAPALSVSIIPFTGQGRPEDRMGSILRAMDEVRSIEPEIIMLYATRESTELFLQQVIPDVALFSVSTMFFKTFDFDQKIQYLFFFFFHKETTQPQERFQMDTSGRGKTRELSK